MQSFGFKVLDKDAPEIRPVIERALQAAHPIEIGLYFDDPVAGRVIKDLLGSGTALVNTHLDHAVLNVMGFDRCKREFAAAIKRSQALGATYSITHLADYPVSLRSSMQERLLSTLMHQLERINALCTELDYAIHIENTFHGVALYRVLFDRIRAAGLTRIHFCFDIGHAKVWSSETLPDWLVFLDELRAGGFRLHFHLHQNRGLGDDHLSFLEADPLGLNEPDPYTDSKPYLETLALIDKMFPESRKVFEVEPGLAIANMDFVTRRLARIASGIGDTQASPAGADNPRSLKDSDTLNA